MNAPSLIDAPVTTRPAIPAPAPRYPQAPDLPEPLTIHPSVDPELARGLIAAVEYINEHPDEFDMIRSRFKRYAADFAERGCVICHVEKLSNWRRPNDWEELARAGGETPLGDWRRIFWPVEWITCLLDVSLYSTLQPFNTHEGRCSRIEHFLMTGE